MQSLAFLGLLRLRCDTLKSLLKHPNERNQEARLLRLPAYLTEHLHACSLLRPMGDADMAINVVEYDSNWERLGGAEFTMQHSFFNPHDFAITPNNYIFFQVRQS